MLQAAIDKSNNETEHAIKLQDPEKQELMTEIASLNAKVEE